MENQTEPNKTVIDAATMTHEQRIQVLASVHGFFANFDRVPGHLTGAWHNNLTAIELVIKNLQSQ